MYKKEKLVVSKFCTSGNPVMAEALFVFRTANKGDNPIKNLNENAYLCLICCRFVKNLYNLDFLKSESHNITHARAAKRPNKLSNG